MSAPTSLFINDDWVIDLSKVAFVEPQAEVGREDDQPVHLMVVHMVGVHDQPVVTGIRLHDKDVQQKFLAALVTYHELFVSPAKVTR